MPTLHLSAAELAPLNARLATLSASALLRWTADLFGHRAALLSSMQRAGTLLCHLAASEGLALDVLFVDTGVLHPETLATRDALARAHPRLRVLTLHPEHSFAAQTAAEGLLYLSREGQERCCDQRKTAPLLAQRGRYDALVSALRRGEGGARAQLQPLELDPAMNALRVHPFAAWDDAALDAYAREHPDAVQNPLHSLGFRTIGCFPCTSPVRPDEPERAGRWRHLAGVQYCGINPTDRASREEPSLTLDERYAAALLP